MTNATDEGTRARKKPRLFITEAVRASCSPQTEKIKRALTDTECKTVGTGRLPQALDRSMVGKRVRTRFDNQWYGGDIKYVRAQAQEFKIAYDDGETEWCKAEDLEKGEVEFVDRDDDACLHIKLDNAGQDNHSH